MKRVSPTNENPAPKRAKASQACSQCRRQKSRCEILDVRPASGAIATIRCHRCKVLGVECSFETSDLIHFSPKTILHTSAETSPAVSVEHRPDNCCGASLNTLATIALSGSNVDLEEGAVNSIRGQYAMSLEDLVPTAATPIWGSLSRVDWTATPMLAIQDLVRIQGRTPSIDTVQLPSAGTLSDILSSQEITSLLEIFETRYTPWLCAQPGPLQGSNSLLDIVRCTIASRHLSPTIRSTIAPRLQKLTEDVFLREIFNPQPSLESIRALLILSVWTPICGTGAEARDGRLLIASAVSMAMNLHLQDESKRVVSLRGAKDGLSPDKQAELNESTQRWRLWMNLSISESMLCLGTGRTPVSHFSQLDQQMVDLSSLPDFTPLAVRDLRLGLSAKMFDITETALKLRLKSVGDLGSFFEEINSRIQTTDGLSRLLTPLPVITQYDSFYSQMLLLQYNACRLLIMHHALRETRMAYERDKLQMPWYTAEIKGHCLSMSWGYAALISAENVLSTFLSPSDFNLLSSAPDVVYAMIGFAATWIFVSNFSLHQLGKSQVGGASERLQSMTIERLNQIALSPDHAAARCRHVLSALMSAWQRRKPEQGTLPVNMCMLDVPFSRFPVREPVDSGEGNLDPPSYDEDPAGDAASNSDLFMDDAFWASFVENLNSDSFIAQNSIVV
ncbi:hypothetical protein B0H19DRAFT_1098632 [Mycena capillaripes]|nr:hypothetical protein B0H19DRAFT_1098632 [Mycena capillaripes]